MIEMKITFQIQDSIASIAINTENKDTNFNEIILCKVFTDEIKDIMDKLTKESKYGLLAEGESAKILLKNLFKNMDKK